MQRRLAAAESLLDDISREIDFAKRQESVLKDIAGILLMLCDKCSSMVFVISVNDL